MQAVEIVLSCWHCQKRLTVQVSRPPQFAFELASIANSAGWYGAIDMNRGRTLVFCCEEHAEAEKTKAGTYRARPKGVSK